MRYKYAAIEESEVPEHVRFDVPRRNQGQIVEVGYADARPLADEADVGSLYKRITDRSIGPDAHDYYRLVGWE